MRSALKYKASFLNIAQSEFGPYRSPACTFAYPNRF